jgi:hypothetical protein
MRLSLFAVVGLVSAALLSACAAESTAPRSQTSESSYVTGSNIPRRDSRSQNGVSTTTIDPTTTRGAQSQTR